LIATLIVMAAKAATVTVAAATATMMAGDGTVLITASAVAFGPAGLIGVIDLREQAFRARR
jgi:hypothetical protein